MIRQITVRGSKGVARDDALVLPLYRGAKSLSAAAARLDRAFGSAGSALLAGRGFKGDRGETRAASIRRGRHLRHVVILGLGDAKRANPEDVADAAGAGARALLALRAASAAVFLDDACGAQAMLDAGEFAHAVVKALALSPYEYRVGPRAAPVLKRVAIVTDHSAAAVDAAVRRARLLVPAMVRVRDWVNAPANVLTPKSFADDARRYLLDHGVECTAWGRPEIAKAKLAGVLAVGAGSRAEPRLLVAHTRLARKQWPLVCLVGKGVTFDSGGISIKPWEKMHEMKSDMAGAASVVAAMAVAARLQLPVRLVALVPCVENMPGGGAFRPGDVLTLVNGKTVEVLTTDAEGRILLADAVAYARARYRPDVIVDMATLTGGVVIALGGRVAGIFGNSPRDLDDMRAAGERSGEPVWPLPLDERFGAMVKGEISDYKNYAGRGASPITGAALVGAFAESTPWVHVDIAGTSWNEGDGPSYQTRGATGYGVDLLLRYLEIVSARV
jgi:leucyl aminopeptidase